MYEAPASHVSLVKFHRANDRLKGVYKRPTMFGNCKREENRNKMEDVAATLYHRGDKERGPPMVRCGRMQDRGKYRHHLKFKTRKSKRERGGITF
ncbi:unnamed protein product [Lasius platythorax]|uniref:Uncharacterized protein n=1 Tax=Lasius platythorax TaxID=488582 RepID=A0AAV2P2A9_9HYME